MRIVIVGAGPAGCHTLALLSAGLAHRLQNCRPGIPGTAAVPVAATDHEILLFDPRAPWEKPCGGGLRAASRSISGVEGSLVGQHFPEVMALPFPRHSPTRLLLRASDGSQVEQSFTPPPRSIVSRADLGRALLDRALRSTAAAAVANGHVHFLRQKVIDAEQTAGGWRLRTTSGQTLEILFHFSMAMALA